MLCPYQGDSKCRIVQKLIKPTRSTPPAPKPKPANSQRLSRQFEKTLAKLRELQRPRRAQESHDLDALLEITEMYEERGETYNPKEDGFVFTKSQVNQAILARNRDRLLEEAYEAAA